MPRARRPGDARRAPVRGRSRPAGGGRRRRGVRRPRGASVVALGRSGSSPRRPTPTTSTGSRAPACSRATPGWAAGQLEAELREDAWIVVIGAADRRLPRGARPALGRRAGAAGAGVRDDADDAPRPLAELMSGSVSFDRAADYYDATRLTDDVTLARILDLLQAEMPDAALENRRRHGAAGGAARAAGRPGDRAGPVRGDDGEAAREGRWRRRAARPGRRHPAAVPLTAPSPAPTCDGSCTSSRTGRRSSTS